jgi:hypothetical protein
MKRRIHTTIATLVAIVAVSALGVPKAAAERTKPGSSGQTKAQQCEMYKLAYDLAWQSAQEAKADGDWNGYVTMMDYMDANLGAARRLGCGWTRYAVRVSQVQTSSGPILASPRLNLR